MTDSIFDLRPDLEAGELYESIFGSVLENEADFIYAYQNGHLRRRIETTMTEREAFIEAGIELSKEVNPYFLGKMFDA